MKLLIIILLGLFLAAPAFAERILRAKSISTNQWYQRIDSGDKNQAIFKAEVAAQFRVPASDILVVVTNESASDRLLAVTEMAAGSHRGLGVISAPPAVKPARQLRREAKRAAITGATTLNDLKAAILMPD